ncbi:chlorophyllase/cutinase-like alpha/beta fold protein [Testudinibacter aquarius]|uniref:Alpha/beta hydrolase n=1 Tax=Testudinibacter aquarius TaxID=1524974 RepID=A0A4R3YBU3_9PAST|nr:alpha/beta hydrolase [Testudinibacter aquarius]KAE9528965.1 hypothetical protein A1D24_08820 [Testudinibacter aquarius]TCV89241.1 chlorophyllase-like protein [Testudinibacter aquarius]TNG93303.1 alpha/beta hydrolase [Testudinibacter aquarius]
MKKIILTLTAAAVLGLLGLAGCAGLGKAIEQALAITDEKITQIQTTAPLEKQYSQMGRYAVASAKFDAQDKELKTYTVYYPQTGSNYPLIVMANGSGTPVSKYEPVLKHLASHGFVVIGSEELSSWRGTGAAKSLDFALAQNRNQNSVLFNKINADKIGVSGHSQGGAGAINLAMKQPNSHLVRSLYTASTTRGEGEMNLFDFAPWQVDKPYFAVTSNGAFDKNAAPISKMQDNLRKMPSTNAVVAERKGLDHGAMLYAANGYMTAWFLYTLNNDAQARQVFIGQNAELYRNANWQNVRAKN